MRDVPVEQPQFCKSQGSSGVGSRWLCESHQLIVSSAGRLAERRAVFRVIRTG